MDERRLIVAAFFTVLVIGAGLRLAFLDWQPPIFDEVALILSTKQYMDGNWLHNFVAFDTPPLTKYLLVLSFSLAGYSEFALRIFSALFGIGTVAITFFITRRLYSHRTALVAATTTSFSMLHMAFSRDGEHLVPVGFFYLLALWLIYDYAENGNKKNFLLLGAAAALGLMTKYLMIYFIITAFVYLVIKKKFNFRIKPAFSIIIDNFILKTLIVFIVVFLVLWPMFLYPLHVDMSVLVDNSKQRNISFSVPEGFLTFGEVSKSALTEEKTMDITGIPLGYFWLFMIKESLLFVALFFAGLYFMLRERKRQDLFIMFSLLIFLLMLWFQNWGHSYRYFAAILPVISIISARWVEKTKKYFWPAFIAVVVIMASFAFYYFPDYVLYYNNLSGPTSMETHFSEGLRDVINVTGGCSLIYTDRANEYMLGFVFGYDRVSSHPAGKPDCVVVGMASYHDPVFNLSYANACTEIKTVTAEKFNRELFKVYRC